MDWTHSHQGIRSFFFLTIIEERTTITRFHGIDRHKKYYAKPLMDHKGEEIPFQLRCTDLKRYIQKLGPGNAVILEASTEAFYWVDRVESRSIERFPTSRKMKTFVGPIPRVKDSGGKSTRDHITRESRKLASTLLTKSIYHVSNASPYFRRIYVELTEKQGAGRARRALIRKVCGVMRRMLLTEECYRWMNNEFF